jgi:sugar phosphate isomerase/epimerase
MIRLSAFADEIAPDPVAQMDVLQKHGIRHIEFRSIFGTNVLDLTDAQHEDFRRLLHDRGMALSAIGSPIGKFPIEEPFEAHLPRFERACHLAAFHGTRNIRVFSYFMPKGEDRSRFRDEVVRRMEAKTRIAADRGLRLVLENEKGIYGETAPPLREILDAIDSPALGLAFDPANFVEAGQSIDEAWSLLRDRVVHFHVKDYSKALGKNVPAGEGDGQIARLIADAVATGYDGFCVLEPHLVVAEASYGYTGPDRFADAANALKGGLDQHGVSYA